MSTVAGTVYSSWTTLGPEKFDKGGRRLVECVCVCGNVRWVGLYVLKTGRSLSCGCVHLANGGSRVTHGFSRRGNVSPTYRSWQSMKRRCLEVVSPSYKNYGGRGITVCDRWLKFENFLADMGERPEGFTLSRVDNDGDYEPSNCTWASIGVQSLNKRNTVVTVYMGKVMTLFEAASLAGLKYATAYRRLKMHGCIE